MINEDEVRRLVEQAGRGDREAVTELFTLYREQLRRLVAFRLDDRLRARVDPSDVVQEAQLEVYSRLPQYLAEPRLPFHLWLRLEVGKHLANVHRQHLGAQKRDPRREVPLQSPDPSSDALVGALMHRDTPSQEVALAERAARLRAALDALEPIDREVLTLRHFEMLERGEVALLLGISENAVSRRYLRALERLERALARQPGGLDAL
jgi:RNA polymerase sigma-70 factor (ECF subfamily)